MIEMQLSNVIYVSSRYIWSVINLTLLTANIFKDQLILGFVYIILVLFCLSFKNLTDKDFSCSILNENYIEISNKNSSVLLKPTPNLALLFNQLIILSQSNKLILKMLWILDILILTKSNHKNFPKKRSLSLSSILMHVH